MKAVILAGGQGKRLRPLTYTKTKPMIPFLNKPVMEHIVTKLAGQGIDDIIITTNYKVEQIQNYFGDGSKWGVKVTTVNEDDPLGTAGSVKNAVDHLDDTFVVIQGDNISDIDVHDLYESHKELGGMATIALMEVEDVSHFGIAEMKHDEIVRFKEKPKPEETFSNLANTGIYIFEPKVLDMIPLAFYDFSKNLFPKMIEEGKKICGHVTHDFWKDVGKPEDYLEASHYFLHDENMIDASSTVDDSEIFESVLGRDCKVNKSTIRHSVLFDKVKVADNCKIKHCIIGSNCQIGKNVDIWPGAVIGDNVIIQDNSEVRGDARIGPSITVEGRVSGEHKLDGLEE
jgi:mannose-1-phosphate guanylyltransferase